ncbi:MAG: gliding motility protein GldB-related protein, partial [Bacteroidales bacterium]
MNKLTVILFFIVLTVASCQSSDKPENVPQVQLKTYHFYKDLFSLPIDSIPVEVPSLLKKYSPFFELFGSNVIHIGFPEEQRFGILLRQFVSDFNMQKVFNDIEKEFPDTKMQDFELQKAFSYFHYYMPNKPIPQIYYFHGGFNHSVITTDSIIGIGLDKYLGTNYSYYFRLGLPEYQRIKMRKEYIPIDAMRFYLYGIFPYNENQDNVLSHIIYEGKIQYILDKCFPDVDDTLKFGFSKNQLIWCEKSERSMWQYLIDKKKLFST